MQPPLIECLTCGAVRLPPGGAATSDWAGSCTSCGELGWAYESDLADAVRAHLRRRLLPPAA